MKRLLTILLAIATSVLLILWFQDHLGKVEIQWLGYKAQTNLALALMVIFLGILLLSLVVRLIRSIFGIPSWFREKASLKQQKKLAIQLRHGLISFVMKDGDALALESDGFKRSGGDIGFTHFFRAEAAVMKGDRKTAHDLYLELSRLKGFEVLGLNGLLKLALERGGYEEVLYYVMACEKYYVSSPWLMDILFETALRFDKFDDALDALRRKKTLKLLKLDEYQKKMAMVLLAQAIKAQSHGNEESYERFIEQSYESDETYLPTLLHFLPLLLKEEKHSRLRKIVERNWPASPHPDLARFYAQSMPGASDVEVFRLIQRLSSFAPHHPESRLEMARYAMRAKLWGQSREHLDALLGENVKSPEIYFLLAQLEEDETGDVTRAWPWLEKLANLSYQGNWFCRSCLGCQTSWNIICPNCNALGELEWASL
jgi:HemY protein